MDIFRNLGQFVPSPRSQLAVRSSRSVEMICNPFARNYETQGYGQLNSTAGRYIPLDPRLRKEILNQSVTYAVNSYETSNENRSRKRTRDSSDEYHLDAKRNLSDYNHNGRRDHDENYTGKRALDDDESCHSVKRQRTSEICVQYAIKKPSQSPITNRKILESLYDPEITAEGWEKNRVGFKYHTEIRGKCFYELGDSIDHAKELVAETALKELCNLKQEEIIWPEKLERFRLNQDFADEIERMVKRKFDEIMKHELQFKGHRVLSGIVMTSEDFSSNNAKVVAIGTGTSCISNKKEDDFGSVLHDMHAEVLARRSFVRFLYDQLKAITRKKSSIFESDGREIRLKKGLKFHLYINAIPCGDARVSSSKECLHMRKDATMGALRYKIFGGTEPISENSFRISSMSCSDKIARWNVLGLQGSFLAKFIKPIYLESIVLGSTYNPVDFYRATIGRLDVVVTDLPKDYYLNKPKFESTSLIETENFTTSAYGVCWNDGSVCQDMPEILNLNTGLTLNGEKSKISKVSLINMYKSVNRNLSVRSDAGMTTFQAVKDKFYTALKKGNFGAWEKRSFE